MHQPVLADSGVSAAWLDARDHASGARIASMDRMRWRYTW
jgi:hypothetical protein